MGNKKWLERLALGLILFNILFLLTLLRVQPKPTITSYESEEGLRCEQAFQVGKWGSTRYGGPHHIEVSSPLYGSKTAQIFIEKLDPLKVLFTQPEVDKLKKQAKQLWRTMPSSGDCSLFENWYKTDYQTAKARFKKQLAESRFGTDTSDEGQDLQDIVRSFPKFKKFAKNEKERRDRMIDLSSRIVERSAKKLRDLYRGDYHRLAADTFEQVLFAENTAAIDLLAKSILGGLDPYSTYMPPNEYEEFYQELAAGGSGIGLKVRKVPEGLFVEKIVADSPAGKSNKFAIGDIITGIEGSVVKEMPLKEAKRLLKGREGDKVRITFVREKKSTTVTLVRESYTNEEARVQVKTVKFAGNSTDKVAVVEVPSFYGRGTTDVRYQRSSAEDLEEVLRSLMKKDSAPSAIVVDLRKNPGGFLEEAVSAAGLFIGDKPVVGVVEKKQRRVLRDTRPAIYSGPLLVLVDRDSASAAEVLAGALKDHHRALVVGASPSYGKGSVQRLFHLEDEFSLFEQGVDRWPGVAKITTSLFYSPLGHSPANGGVKPDVVIDEDDAEEGDDGDTSEPVVSTVPETKPFLASNEMKELAQTNTDWKEVVTSMQKEIDRKGSGKDLKLESDVELDPALRETVFLAQKFSTVAKQKNSVVTVPEASPAF